MDELMISGKRYISSRRAAKEFHYHSDYIGQLIRAGKLQGQKVGRTWYVLAASLDEHLRKEESAEKPKSESTVSLSHADRAPISVPAVSPTIAPVAPVVTPAPMPTTGPAVPSKKEEAHTLSSAAPELKRELKMLTYLPDDTKDAEIAAKEKEPRGSVAAELSDRERISNVSAPSAQQPIRPAESETHEAEDTPIPLRITSKPPVSAPAVSTTSESNLYFPYGGRETAASAASKDLPRRKGIVGMIIVLLVLAIISLGGSFFVSLMPEIHQVFVTY